MKVAVVGAGPAGSLLAWRLASEGAAPTVFDASHPREKPCGGGLTGRTLALVAAAVPASAVAGVPVARAAFIDARGGRVFIEGENWNAVSETPVEAGQPVEVAGIEGLTLKVKPKT